MGHERSRSVAAPGRSGESAAHPVARAADPSADVLGQDDHHGREREEGETERRPAHPQELDADDAERDREDQSGSQLDQPEQSGELHARRSPPTGKNATTERKRFDRRARTVGMFTGIVEESGALLERVETTDGLRLRIGCSFADELRPGQSVGVSGACLTVEEASEDRFSAFLAAETLSRTYLGELLEGDRVNLERAMPADGRFDGHLVQGHVDATGEVRAIEPVDEDWRFAFSLPEALAPYLVEKGSVTVDGISLTVATRRDEVFDAAIIPTTYELTTLGTKEVGDPIHLEADVIAKYVERVAEPYLRGRTR